MEWSSIIHRRLELVTGECQRCLVARSRMCTYRLGGSLPCLRWAVFAGSKSPIFSESSAVDANDDSASRSCKSSDGEVSCLASAAEA